jgi:hypothetical protein
MNGGTSPSQQLSREVSVRCIHFVVANVMLSSIAVAPAVAADLPKDGRYDVQAFCSGPVHLATPLKDQMGGSYSVRCMANADQGTIFHGVLGICNGAFHQVGDAYYEAGSCEFSDAAGDKFFGVYEKKGQANGTWKVTGGSGKYATLTQTGEFSAVLPFPMPSDLTGAQFHWWGTSKLR